MEVNEFIRKDLIGMKPYESARHEFTGSASVWLDANENPSLTKYNRYPDPYQVELKRAISVYKGIPAEKLFIGNGSDEVLDLILRLTCTPGLDSVASPDPSYGMYEVLSRINMLDYRKIALDSNFEIAPEKLIEDAAGSKVLFICRPNNPTGNLMPKDDVLSTIRKFDGVVVVDEAYIDFCKSESLAGFVDDYPNLIVVQTLSKSFGMAGLRIGIGIASKNWIDWLNAIKPPYNISSLTQEMAIEELNRSDWKSNIREIISERERLTDFLNQFAGVTEVFISEANFILFRVANAAKLYDFLSDKGIIIRNRSSQYNCENTLRITVGTTEENNQFINALKAYENAKEESPVY